MTETAAMTPRERSELTRLCKQREKLAKAKTAQRAGQLMADFEETLAREYAWDEHENWAEAMRVADAAIKDVNTTIAESLQALGIPKRFAPSANVSWYRRGENATAERRGELRRVAQTRIDALKKQACVQIEAASLETQTELLSDGLKSGDAKRFLETMPTAEALMPTLDVGMIEKQIGAGA